MASVTLEHVTKQYGGVTAVHEVNLAIDNGEFLVLLGPSGCGKTTTLRMVAGLEEVTAGRIMIGNREVTEEPPKDRDIAMVFQNYALYPHMSVFENMAFGLKLRKTPRSDIERRVKAAAEILGLQPYLQRKPRELSGGQRQRVALGRAIVREPAAFLMDEPLSNLDARLRDQTRVELKGLHQRIGTTTLYVTHDQTEAMTLGTRIVVMRDGKVQQVDSPEAIYRNPANQFVATFVGTPAMNLLSGTVADVNGIRMVKIGGQTVPVTGPLGDALERLTGKSVTVGVRPEDITVRPPEDGPHLTASVRVVEPMGHEKLLYCDLEGTQVTVREDNAWPGRAGDQVALRLDPDTLHLFDPETEDRVQ